MEILNMPLELQDFIYLFGVAIITILLGLVAYFLKSMATKLASVESRLQLIEIQSGGRDVGDIAFRQTYREQEERLKDKLESHSRILHEHNDKLIKHGIEIIALQDKTGKL